MNVHLRVLALTALALGACNNSQTTPPPEITPLGVLPSSSIVASNGSNSAFANRLSDVNASTGLATTGVSDAESWSNSGNAWASASYPMTAQLDLGQDRTLSAIEYFVGNIPFPAFASLRLRYKTATGAWVGPYTDAPGSAYNTYKAFSGLGTVVARYIELSFDSSDAANKYKTRFNISDVRITETNNTLAAPTNLNVVASSSNSITLGWSAVPGATAYTVERNGSTAVTQPTTGQTSVTHTGLAANTTYAYRVRASNGSVLSDWSVVLNASTQQVVTGDDDASTITLAQYQTQNDMPATHKIKQAALPDPALRSVAYTHQFNKYQNENRNPNDCGPNTHGRYWTLGPDLKAYPTWHPAKDTAKNCFFGHEHGDNPWPNEIYANMNTTYSDVRQKRMLPVPFGYAGEVLVNVGQKRVWVQNATDEREDHVGYKIFAEKFLIANQNTANFFPNAGTQFAPATENGTNITCSAVVAVHQGTHSGDALTSHLHEASTHISCSNSVRVHTTLMSPVGKPGWFSNECGFTNQNTSLNPPPTPTNYPPKVPNAYTATAGTDPNTVNNTLVQAPALNFPFNAGQSMPYGSATPTVQPGVSMTSSQVPASVASLGFQPDGERVIPSKYCLGMYSWETKVNRKKYGFNTIENWTFPITITMALNQAPIFVFRPYAVVANPARVFDDTNLATPTAIKAWDVCKGSLPQGRASDGFAAPDTKTTACQNALTQNPGATWKDTASPYKGNARWMNFKGITLNNAAGNNTWIVTNPYGFVQTPSTNYSSNLPQFIKQGSFNQSAAFAGSLAAATGSTLVCSPAESSNSASPCFSADQDTKFRKEWWRDYSGNAYNDDFSGLHAPN